MKTLIQTINIAVTENQQVRLQRIDTEDYSGVRRKVREELAKQGIAASEDYLDRGILALKQYYAVAMLDPNNMHAVSDVIDPFWHMHILHTKQYVSFCDDVIGDYMHHDPLDHADTEELRAVKRLYDYTLEVYERMFNHVDPEFHPEDQPLNRMICVHGGTSSSELQQQTIFPVVPEFADIYEHYSAKTAA